MKSKSATLGLQHNTVIIRALHYCASVIISKMLQRLKVYQKNVCGGRGDGLIMIDGYNKNNNENGLRRVIELDDEKKEKNLQVCVVCYLQY